jgi:DNA polymerase
MAEDALSPLVIDFETYWTDEYSLSRMSTEAYCLDPRFEIISVAMCPVDGDKPVFIPASNPLLKEVLEREVSRRPAVVFHNAFFDGTIMERVLDIRLPKIYCTMTMPRFFGLGYMTGSSLSNLSQVYKLPPKGDFLVQSKGRHLSDFSPIELLDLSEYNVRDVLNQAALFRMMEPWLTQEALDFISLTVKMYVSPSLELDSDLLESYRRELVEKQERDMTSLQAFFNFQNKEDFMKALRSRGKFCEMLRSLGAEVPMKESEAQARKYAAAVARVDELSSALAGGKPDKKQRRELTSLVPVVKSRGQIEALSKTDEGFMELMEGDNEAAALLARLRAENNSSLAMTRAERLLEVAGRGGVLPIPLAPWGAHTGRYAAGIGHRDALSDKLNLQNLPKRGPDKTLRKAIRAPEGHVLVVGDSAQIEARVGAWLAGQNDLVEVFRRGEDPYVRMAGAIYGEDPEKILVGAKKERDPRYEQMRNVGKTTVLSAQYGIGGATFAKKLKIAKIVLDKDPGEHVRKATGILKLYNGMYSNIKNFRRTCGKMIEWLSANRGRRLEHTDVKGLSWRTDWTAGPGLETPAVVLPSGFAMIYPGLRWSEEDKSHVYDLWKSAGSRMVTSRIYGGALFENITQALAFSIIACQAVRTARRYRVVANVHDSLVCLVPKERAGEAETDLKNFLSEAPEWCRGLPLGAEVQTNETFEIA